MKNKKEKEMQQAKGKFAQKHREHRTFSHNVDLSTEVDIYSTGNITSFCMF
jgi:hypothetical protein